MRTCRALSSLLLTVPLLMLLFATPASAAGGLLDVDLPLNTNRLTLTVSGAAPAGSLVESPQALHSATANDAGRFWITLALKEGKNQITVTANSPENAPLTWEGATNVNLAAPTLAVELPRSINDSRLAVLGQAPSGSKVTVQGKQITPDAEGRFRTSVSIQDPGMVVTVTATDAAGNQTEVRGYVFHRRGRMYPRETVEEVVLRAPVGSQVAVYFSSSSDGVRTKVGEPKLDAEGRWSGRLKIYLNWNYYWFVVTPPEGEQYVELYEYFKPFMVPMVTRTNLATVKIPGEVVPGYTITTGGNKAQIDDSGRFVGTINLVEGEQWVEIATEAENKPQGLTRASSSYKVTRVPAFEPLHEPQLTLRHQSYGDVFVVQGTSYPVDRYGNVTIPLQLEKGKNLVVLPVITRQSEARVHIYEVEYVPVNVVRLTVDNTTAEVDGTPTPMPVAPMIRENSTYLPLRFLGEVLGAKVEWDQATRTATYTRGTRVIRVTVGETRAMVDGQEVTLSSPVVLENDRTLVPVRFISENLGAKVTWEPATRTVTVVMPKD